MWTTFIYTIKALVRDRSVLMWAVAFPLVLSTLFYALFHDLDKIYQLEPINVIVVEDNNYHSASAFSELINGLSEQDQGQVPLLDPSFVPTISEAADLLAQGGYYGYIVLDDSGTPEYYLDSRRQSSTDPSQSIIKSILDRYVQNSEQVAQIVQTDPQLLADPDFLSRLLDSEGFTERISVTANAPSDSLRYFYAVLAFATIMMTSFAQQAVDLVQPNVSALGARRSLGGQSRLKTLVPTLAASWFLSFLCVFIGFLYIRYVFGISFGGKEPACILTLAVSTLVANFLGALLGSLPIGDGVKGGIIAFLSCFLGAFAGLYGPSSQQLGDLAARELPWLQMMNPVRQVADAFFSLYYYDGYARLFEILGSLSLLGFVFFIVAVLMMRRQRYASL